MSMLSNIGTSFANFTSKFVMDLTCWGLIDAISSANFAFVQRSNEIWLVSKILLKITFNQASDSWQNWHVHDFTAKKKNYWIKIIAGLPSLETISFVLEHELSQMRISQQFVYLVIFSQCSEAKLFFKKKHKFVNLVDWIGFLADLLRK